MRICVVIFHDEEFDLIYSKGGYLQTKLKKCFFSGHLF